MDIKRGVEDQKAFDKGLNNTTTAHGLATLLRRDRERQSGRCRNPQRRWSRSSSGRNSTKESPRACPPNIRVAHKTGEITKIHHDAGIVYAERPFVIVVLVRGIEDFKQSSALIADVTRDLYQASQASDELTHQTSHRTAANRYIPPRCSAIQRNRSLFANRPRKKFALQSATT